MTTTSDAQWDELRAAAIAASARAYAPYSGYRVGAAARVADGRIVSGCNVENVSYGLTLCAECGLVSDLHATGGGRLAAFVCVDADGEPIMPCGRCRQLLVEHALPGMLLDTAAGIRTIDEVLPDAFGGALRQAQGPRAGAAERGPGAAQGPVAEPVEARDAAEGTVAEPVEARDSSEGPSAAQGPGAAQGPVAEPVEARDSPEGTVAEPVEARDSPEGRA